MITDEMLGITPGTRVVLLAQAAQEDVPALPEQHAEYLGDGMFEVDEEDRLPDDEDGLVEVGDPNQFRLVLVEQASPVWVERTPWSVRRLFNTWRKPFPYLFHPWQVMCPEGYCSSGSARYVCKWMAGWHELEMKEEEND